MLGQLHVGSRQRIAVIRVADRTLVVGVTEGSINTLAELDLPAAEAKKEADEPKIFAELLAWRKAGPEPAPKPDGPAPASPAVEDEGPRLFAPGERPPR